MSRIILFLIISCSCVLAQEAKEKMDVFRLPNNTEPISYKLNIKTIIDPENNDFKFTGDVTINIQVKTTTEELILNADGLQITKVEVKDTNALTEVKVRSYSLLVINEQLKIQLDQPGLIADRVYDVQITYSGQLRRDMTGFYLSSYTDEESQSTKWLATTQFEPTYARRTFPCYDEPAFKTPFSIFIIRKDTQISLSNTPISRNYQIYNEPPTYICDQYVTTEPIPTYLVAFSVSEFVSKTNQRISIYTHKEYIDQVQYIQEKAEQLLNLMEIYTKIPYSNSKMDFLALPDFSFGAMENWGLNIYREKYLLVTNKSSEKDKELVITTVQHELSHQWFGDLVTCSSWNYLWLNEAFATLFEYFAVQVLEPNWRVGDMFVIEQHQEALAYDHRPNHPITSSVNTPDEIQDIFDLITYSKGASVLRMLKYVLNDDIFRTSLSLYLNTYKHKSVEPKNLWDTFDNVLYDAEFQSGILGDEITVGEFMSSWTDQAGYPVISVLTSSNKNSVIITQKRFQVDKPDLNDMTLWHIGLTHTTENMKEFNDLRPSIWINNTQHQITVPLTKVDTTGWVIFNLQSTGFYRVNYDSRNWKLLIAQMKSNPKKIHVLNRAQLIDDSFNLARADELSYFIPFTLVDYLDKEDDFIPMYSVMNSLTYLVERLRRCPHTGLQMLEFTKKYAKIVYEKVSKKYEKSDPKHLTMTSMQAFSNWACKLDIESCTQSASNHFNNWQNNGVEIPPEVKEAALCVGVKNGTKETWNIVFKLFLNTSSTSERQATLLALACSKNNTVLSGYLNLLLADNCPIRPQDYRTVFKSLASTPIGINVTIEFLQNKINETLSSMWQGEEMIMLMYSTLAKKVSTKKEIDELNVIRNFNYLSSTLKESFDESYKEVKLNSAYFARAHPLMHDWFDPENKTSTSSCSTILNSYLILMLMAFYYYFIL